MEAIDHAFYSRALLKRYPLRPLSDHLTLYCMALDRYYLRISLRPEDTYQWELGIELFPIDSQRGSICAAIQSTPSNGAAWW